MLTLYDYLSSGNGYKVRLVLNQLAIPYQRVELDIMTGATRTPEFLAKNPNGRIPALQIESGEILRLSNETETFLYLINMAIGYQLNSGFLCRRQLYVEG